jgi:hypothetical protein
MISKKYLTRGALLLVMAVLVFFWLVPLVTTFLTALKTTQEAAATFPWQLPQGFALPENIAWAWTNGRLGQSFIRSILYAGLGAACHCDGLAGRVRPGSITAQRNLYLVSADLLRHHLSFSDVSAAPFLYVPENGTVR